MKQPDSEPVENQATQLPSVLQEQRLRRLAEQRKHEFQAAQRIFETQKQRVREAEAQTREHMANAARWRRRARLWAALALLCLAAALLSFERYRQLAAIQTAADGFYDDLAATDAGNLNEIDVLRRAERQTRIQLARSHWIDGVAARDRAGDPLGAAQHFVRAAALEPRAAEADNARQAAELLRAPFDLDNLFEHAAGAGVTFGVTASRILGWSESGAIRVWDSASGAPLTPAMEHAGRVYQAHFNGDDSRILSWSEDGAVRVWDSATGAPLTPAMEHAGEVYGALFNRDETRILSWGTDGAVRLWDSATGAAIIPPIQHAGRVIGAAFMRDENRILSWSWDPFVAADAAASATKSTLQIWDIITGAATLDGVHHAGRINGAVLNADASRILTWGSDGSARLWDSETGAAVTPPLKHAGWVTGAAFSRAGDRILSWSEDGTARLWNSATGKPIAVMQHAAEVNGAVFSHDESRILSWSLDGSARLWNSATGTLAAPPLQHEHWVLGAAFNADGSEVLSWSRDGMIRLWDSGTGRELGAPLWHGAGIISAAFGAEETRLLSLAENGEVRVWRRSRKHAPGARVEGRDYAEQAFRLDWDEHGMAQVSAPGAAAPITTSIAREDWIDGIALSADASLALIWGGDMFGGLVHVRDNESGQPLTALLKHKDRVSGALFGPEPKRILSWSEDGEVRLWDSDAGALLIPPLCHRGRVAGARFDTAGQRILSWSLDGVVRLWDSATGQALSPSLEYGGGVYGAAFNNDESRILIWGTDGAVRAWDLEPAEELPARYLRLGLEVRTGARLGEFGDLQLLPVNEWRDRHDQYEHIKQQQETPAG